MSSAKNFRGLFLCVSSRLCGLIVLFLLVAALLAPARTTSYKSRNSPRAHAFPHINRYPFGLPGSCASLAATSRLLHGLRRRLSTTPSKARLSRSPKAKPPPPAPPRQPAVPSAGPIHGQVFYPPPENFFPI